MKYLKNNSGTLFIKDFGNGHCVSIHLLKGITYEKMIHFATIELLECPRIEVEKAYSKTLVWLMNTYHEIV